jgi:hypothetical protein
MGFESPETPWAHDDEGERGTSAPSCSSSHLLGKRGVRPKVVCDFKATKSTFGWGRLSASMAGRCLEDYMKTTILVACLLAVLPAASALALLAS